MGKKKGGKKNENKQTGGGDQPGPSSGVRGFSDPPQRDQGDVPPQQAGAGKGRGRQQPAEAQRAPQQPGPPQQQQPPPVQAQPGRGGFPMQQPSPTGRGFVKGMPPGLQGQQPPQWGPAPGRGHPPVQLAQQTPQREPYAGQQQGVPQMQQVQQPPGGLAWGQRQGGPPMQPAQQPPQRGPAAGQQQGGFPMQQPSPTGRGFAKGMPPVLQGQQPPQRGQAPGRGHPPVQLAQQTPQRGPYAGQQQGGPQMQQVQQPPGGMAWGQRQGGPPMQQLQQPPQSGPAAGQQQGGSPMQPTQQPPQRGTGGQQQGGPPKQQHQQPQEQGRAQQQPQRTQQQQGPGGVQASALRSEMAGMQLTRVNKGDEELVSKQRRLPGTQGRVIKVESNHLQLNLGKLETAYHYDVAIKPDKPKMFMRPIMEIFRRKLFPNRYPAYDGKKNWYTASPLTNNLNDIIESDITINEDDDRAKVFKVEVKFANKVDMRPLRNFLTQPVTPQEAIQVVDIVLRMAPVQTCIPVGKSFFVKPTNTIIELGEGMEMYHGFFQSAIRGWKPFLNVDVAHKAFPKSLNVIDSFVEVLSTFRYKFVPENLSRLDRMQQETLTKFVKSLRVSCMIPNAPSSRKNYKVNGLEGSSRNSVFKFNNVQMSVEEYFLKTKNYRLKYPQYPTLWVGNPQRADKILLPIELCTIIEGQAVQRKMTEEQTRNMIKQSATNTTLRKSKIMDGIKRSNFNQSPTVKEFGFSVGDQFLQLDARVLQPPELKYKSSVCKVSKGVWRSNTFLNPATINSWTFVCANRYPPKPDEYSRMVSMFESSARDVGMVFASKATMPFVNVQGRQTYMDALQLFKSIKGKYDVVFVIVPDNGPQYSYVKKAAEIAVGCLTQCIKIGTVSKRLNPQTTANILLKVNSKMNGVNHSISITPPIMRRPVMIMGADVTHPGPDALHIPSVAAVTASHDPKAFQYNICWRLQNPQVEIIADLESITEEHLRFFYEKTRHKPEAIIFFRDGVSEGQFEQVRRAEIMAIRSACKKMQGQDYEPKITFLVVQKRHHTRLFPMNPRDSEDRNLNVPAGTCVDTEIAHPYMQDFYLVSHASIQGVAKPTKYVTLWDDNDMTNDQIEQLAYYLCHMFTRCTRSVSYPAPTYYAHLAAARGRVYIENDQLNMSRLRDEFQKVQILDTIRKDFPMFFV
ncbi:protein argonaute-2 isoform X10 [Dendroctonus ponderosae]|uniref:protein argonaute-2 isoform X10 n=1 Tax=Dendroctonus ponderosae TaxID=77166 RepID=UPI0020364372|nr:protein argonaute-2 isoform X10 [Dendroctonus ponderosae]